MKNRYDIIIKLKKISQLNMYFLLSLIVLAIFGTLYIHYTCTKSNNTTSEKALANARTIEVLINGEMFKQLRAIPEDEGTIAYESIKKRLINQISIQKDVCFIYIYTQKNGKLIIMVDSEPADSKNYSPPGQEYTGANVDYKKPLENGDCLITEPVSDHWGKWISILVPMENTETGEVIAVLGVDYPASIWHSKAISDILQAGIIVFAIFILLIAFYITFLVQLNRQLKELNATKDKLFSIIAHDLRSPFNCIVGFSELLCENIKDYDIEKSGNFIKQINSSAKHTLNLLDNLLAWAKTQTGQIDFKPQKIHVQPIIQEIIDSLDSSARIKNISLNHFQSSDIAVYADKNMLQTVLRNLISNAIKFTNTDGRVDINVISDQDQIKITIADNGVGMDEETQNNLFKIDANLTTNGTANEKGSGLGLILCKEFAEKLGGKIWIESILGEGSKFILTIPKTK
ncbi:MAG: hypothetical protein K8R35_02965 [Bacteroidales bacterium]|nr:hypothetical protein [Bacteroidales bacterium]